jgi:hypothetical protein
MCNGPTNGMFFHAQIFLALELPTLYVFGKEFVFYLELG